MSENSQSNKRIAKNTLLLCIRMFFTLFIGLYTSRVVLKTLGIDDYGIYNVVCGFVSMFAFLNVSMSNGIQRFFNYEFGKNSIDGARKVYITSLVVQALLLLIIILLTETLGLWYLHNKMVIPVDRFEAAQWIYQFSVLSFAFIIMQVPYKAVIMAHERMDFYAFITIFDSILKLIIVVLLPFADADRLVLYGFLLMLIECMNLVLVYIYSKKRFEEIGFVPKFNKKLFRSILSFSSWNIFGTFSNMMREQGLNMILNLFFGPAVNAARGVAYQVTAAMQGFVTNVSIAVRPQIVQSYAQGNTTRTINLMYSLSKLSILTLYIMAYPILLEIDYVLEMWLGDNVPQYTSSFIIIVVLITFINNMNAAVSAVVHATGKMRKYQFVGSCINISSIPIAYYSLKLGYDPNSVFWISLLFTIVMQTASLFILRNLIKFSLKEYAKQVLKPFVLVVIASFMIPIIPLYYMNSGFLRFGIVFLLALSISFITIYLLGLDKKEKILFNSMISKIFPGRR